MKNDFKYIIKRVLIGVLIGIILFSFKSCHVKALSNENLGTYISETGMFLSLNSVNQTSQSGYSLIKGSDFYYALPSGQPFTYGTYGGSITQCDIPVVANNYYALTYYFISNDTYSFHPDYSAFGYKVGVNSTWLNTVPTFNLTSRSGANQFVCISGFNSPFGDCISSYTGIFKAPSNNTCVTMAFSSASHDVTTSEVAFVGYTYESLGNEPLTEQQITNIITNSNQQVLNNIQSSTSSIINNQNSNTQSIISNQNQNTQQQIESEQVCFDYTIQIDSTNKDLYSIGGLYTTSGVIDTSYTSWRVSDYIKINKNEYYNLYLNYYSDRMSYCTYDNNKVLQNCFSYNNNLSFTILTNFDGYIRFSARVGDNSNYTRFMGNYCQNGNQQISGQITDVQDKQDTTNQHLEDISNALTDDTGPNLGGLNGSAGWLPAGPVDSILNLPLTLLNSLNRTLGTTCQAVTLNIPYVNSQLTLPCVITLYEQMGITTWVNTIGVIASAFILFSYLAKLYKWVDDTLTFRENNHIDNWGGV